MTTEKSLHYTTRKKNTQCCKWNNLKGQQITATLFKAITINYHFLHCIILYENPWTFQCYQFVLHYIHTESHCYVSLNYFITKYCTKYQYLLIAFFTQPHPPLWHSHGWTWSNLKFSLPCKYNTKKPKWWFGKKKIKIFPILQLIKYFYHLTSNYLMTIENNFLLMQ